MNASPIKLTRLQNILLNLGCAAPLIGSYYIIPRHTLPFDFYDHYFIFIVVHVYNVFSTGPKMLLPSWLIKGLSVFLLATLVAFLDHSTALNFGFIKQFFGAIFSASSYFIIFRIARFDIILLFRKYTVFAFAASIVAIIEEILHLFSIHVKAVFPGSLGLYRVGGLSGEPYNLSLALFPAVFFYLMNLMNGQKQVHESKLIATIKSATIFLAFFLTFSSTGFIGLFISFVLIAFHKGYLNLRKPRIIFAPVFFAFVYFFFSFLTASDHSMNRKVSDGLWFLRGEQKETVELKGINSSSFALFSNYYITLEGFEENPIAGIGLGNYETLFHEKFGELFGSRFELIYGKSNYNDANSMFLRLLAETGILGLSLVLIFIFSNLIKRSLRHDNLDFYFIAINHAVFVLLLIRLLRCGNYLSDGMFFFILLYFYSHKFYHETNGSIPA